jgi:hypothetical protein
MRTGVSTPRIRTAARHHEAYVGTTAVFAAQVVLRMNGGLETGGAKRFRLHQRSR